MRKRNNRMYQLDQIMLKKKKKREKRTQTAGRWYAVTCEGKMRRGKSYKDDLWEKVIRWGR